MSQKLVDDPDIGCLIITKRRGAKNIRLSINSKGQIRVTIPTWLPYSSGVQFARNKKAWIKERTLLVPKTILREGDLIGKYHRLRFLPASGSAIITCRLGPTEIIIRTNLSSDDEIVQKKAMLLAHRSLRDQSNKLLPSRLEELSSRSNLSYKNIQIMKLTARWGSCSSDKTIKLSYFLVQLPWHLIDYVLAHELAHTVHLNHSQAFWSELVRIYPNARLARKEIKKYQPIVNPG